MQAVKEITAFLIASRVSFAVIRIFYSPHVAGEERFNKHGQRIVVGQAWWSDKLVDFFKQVEERLHISSAIDYKGGKRGPRRAKRIYGDERAELANVPPFLPVDCFLKSFADQLGVAGRHQLKMGPAVFDDGVEAIWELVTKRSYDPERDGLDLVKKSKAPDRADERKASRPRRGRASVKEEEGEEDEGSEGESLHSEARSEDSQPDQGDLDFINNGGEGYEELDYELPVSSRRLIANTPYDSDALSGDDESSDEASDMTDDSMAMSIEGQVRQRKKRIGKDSQGKEAQGGQWWDRAQSKGKGRDVSSEDGSADESEEL